MEQEAQTFVQSLEDIIEDLRSLTKCSICLGPLDERVAISSCLHSFCWSCLETSLKRKAQCPLCSKKLSRRRIREDPTLGKLSACLQLFQEIDDISDTDCEEANAWTQPSDKVAALAQVQPHHSQQDTQSAESSEQEDVPGSGPPSTCSGLNECKPENLSSLHEPPVVPTSQTEQVRGCKSAPPRFSGVECDEQVVPGSIGRLAVDAEAGLPPSQLQSLDFDSLFTQNGISQVNGEKEANGGSKGMGGRWDCLWASGSQIVEEAAPTQVLSQRQRSLPTQAAQDKQTTDSQSSPPLTLTTRGNLDPPPNLTPPDASPTKRHLPDSLTADDLRSPPRTTQSATTPHAELAAHTVPEQVTPPPHKGGCRISEPGTRRASTRRLEWDCMACTLRNKGLARVCAVCQYVSTPVDDPATPSALECSTGFANGRVWTPERSLTHCNHSAPLLHLSPDIQSTRTTPLQAVLDPDVSSKTPLATTVQQQTPKPLPVIDNTVDNYDAGSALDSQVVLSSQDSKPRSSMPAVTCIGMHDTVADQADTQELPTCVDDDEASPIHESAEVVETCRIQGTTATAVTCIDVDDESPVRAAVTCIDIDDECMPVVRKVVDVYASTSTSTRQRALWGNILSGSQKAVKGSQVSKNGSGASVASTSVKRKRRPSVPAAHAGKKHRVATSGCMARMVRTKMSILFIPEDDDNKQQAAEFVNLASVKISCACQCRNWSPHVTHLVCTVPPSQLHWSYRCKYYQALAQGIWILDGNWAAVSNVHGKLLEEDTFVIGDVSGAPFKSHAAAVSDAPKLLSGYTILLIGDFTQFEHPPVSVRTILGACGVELAGDEAEFMASVASGKVGVCMCGSEEGGVDVRGMKTRLGVPVISSSWLTDSLDAYEVKDCQAGGVYDLSV